MEKKPILCLDFDGVLHSYASGWQGADVIPDPPVDGAMEFLERAVERFTVAILSSRSHQPNGKEAMQWWLRLALLKYCDTDIDRAQQVFDAIQWPLEKPPALVTLDDRALQFNGIWPSLDSLAAFKPWNAKKI